MRLENIGPYRIIDRLGSGGMSAVYRAIGPDGVQVAVKLLQPALAEDPQARQRLEREAAVINRVQSTGVASVLDVNTEAEIPYMVMELVHGLSLDKDVKKNGTWEITDLIDLAEWLARILEQLHDASVLHRDIKPSNIMISHSGPVLIDFGISQLNDDDRLTKTGLLTGTTGYLSPQLHQGKDPSEADDWWAWLCVLLFCSTGRLPFGTGNIATVSHRVLNGEADLAGIPEGLGAIFRVGFHPEVEKRPDAWEIIAALHQVAEGKPLAEKFNEDYTKIIGVGGDTALLNAISTVTDVQELVYRPSQPQSGQLPELTTNIDAADSSLPIHGDLPEPGQTEDLDATCTIDTEAESLVGRQAISTHSRGIFPHRNIKLRSSRASFSDPDTLEDTPRTGSLEPDWTPSPSDFDRVVAAAQAAQNANEAVAKSLESSRRKHRLQRFILWLILLFCGLFFFDFGIGMPITSLLFQLGTGISPNEMPSYFIFNHSFSLLQLVFILFTALNLAAIVLLWHANRRLK